MIVRKRLKIVSSEKKTSQRQSVFSVIHVHTLFSETELGERGQCVGSTWLESYQTIKYQHVDLCNAETTTKKPQVT